MSAAGSTVILQKQLESLAPDLRFWFDYHFLRVRRFGSGFRVSNRATAIENYFYTACAAARYVRRILLGRKP